MDSINPSDSQWNALLDYVEPDPEMAINQFSKVGARARVMKKWESLAIIVNAVEGATCIKTGDQWKSSWNSLKCRARRARRTRPDISELYKRVIRIAGPGTAPVNPQLDEEAEEDVQQQHPIRNANDLLNLFVLDGPAQQQLVEDVPQVVIAPLIEPPQAAGPANGPEEQLVENFPQAAFAALMEHPQAPVEADIFNHEVIEEGEEVHEQQGLVPKEANDALDQFISNKPSVDVDESSAAIGPLFGQPQAVKQENFFGLDEELLALTPVKCKKVMRTPPSRSGGNPMKRISFGACRTVVEADIQMHELCIKTEQLLADTGLDAARVETEPVVITLEDTPIAAIKHEFATPLASLGAVPKRRLVFERNDQVIAVGDTPDVIASQTLPMSPSSSPNVGRRDLNDNLQCLAQAVAQNTQAVKELTALFLERKSSRSL